MPKTLFHRTAHAREILAGGFTDNIDNSNGVLLTAAPDTSSDGATDEELLRVTILDSLPLDSYSTDGGGWLIPAGLLNAHAAIRLIDDNDNAATRAARAWLKSQIFELELDMGAPLEPLFADSPQP